jgi:hypothetical protein
MRPGRKAYRSPPTGAEVKDTWIYISTPPCLHDKVLKYRDNLAFFFSVLANVWEISKKFFYGNPT